MKKHLLFTMFSFFTCLIMSVSAIAASVQKSIKGNIVYEDKDIYLRFIQFTPQQIGSFYEGREFKKQAVEKLMASCYVTVILKNKTRDVLWLDLDRWEFNSNGKSFSRQNRAYWKKQWDDIDLKQAHRSTFGWTLMPDVRDLYPDEGVGGRIPIPMQSKSFSVTLNFPTGKNKQGKIKSVKINKLLCKQNK